jgi:hypothetical protein
MARRTSRLSTQRSVPSASGVEDWILVSGLTPSVIPVFEIVKWMEQCGWMGELA